MKIDAHQHFWKYDPLKHSWITDEMKVIKKDFMPDDLSPLLKQNGFTGCVAVQADQTEAETNFLTDLAASNHSIMAVVGWVDLCSENISRRLEHFSQFKIIKGFRHILQSEVPEFMLQEGFLSGIGALAEYHYTYDVLIFPQHLTAAIKLIQMFPNQPFVIDHLAKPAIKRGSIHDWKKDLAQIAAHENVYCKVSGLVTEAPSKNWEAADFTSYLDAVYELFGSNRVMFGSDWPVCLLEADYEKVYQIIEQHFSGYSADEKQKLFGLNAMKFYNIKPAGSLQTV
jgi:L-fuconolactonase